MADDDGRGVSDGCVLVSSDRGAGAGMTEAGGMLLLPLLSFVIAVVPVRVGEFFMKSAKDMALTGGTEAEAPVAVSVRVAVEDDCSLLSGENIEEEEVLTRPVSVKQTASSTTKGVDEKEDTLLEAFDSFTSPEPEPAPTAVAVVTAATVTVAV